MDTIWILVAFWLGGCAGFALFACMQMARQPSREEFGQRNRVTFLTDLEADTATRF